MIFRHELAGLHLASDTLWASSRYHLLQHPMLMPMLLLLNSQLLTMWSIGYLFISSFLRRLYFYTKCVDIMIVCHPRIIFVNYFCADIVLVSPNNESLRKMIFNLCPFSSAIALGQKSGFHVCGSRHLKVIK